MTESEWERQQIAAQMMTALVGKYGAPQAAVTLTGEFYLQDPDATEPPLDEFQTQRRKLYLALAARNRQRVAEEAVRLADALIEATNRG